jgi:hypothetical protein
MARTNGYLWSNWLFRVLFPFSFFISFFPLVIPHKRKQCEMCDELTVLLVVLDKIIARLQHAHDTATYDNIDELIQEYDSVMR